MIPHIWRSRIAFAQKVEATAHLGANMAYLLLAAFCVLVFPGWGFEGDWWRFFLVMDMPIFLFSLVSLGGFYLTAILGRGEAARWTRVFWLPGVIALGMALAVNNGRAVCAGLLRRPSAFRRTPKYGEKGACRGAWRERLLFYRSEGDGQRWVEAALALYFCAITWEAWQQSWWIALPFFALFTSGFALAAWGAPGRAS